MHQPCCLQRSLTTSQRQKGASQLLMISHTLQKAKSVALDLSLAVQCGCAKCYYQHWYVFSIYLLLLLLLTLFSSKLLFSDNCMLYMYSFLY
jgi:hypothetical protein